jgi:hypothetical protein
MKDKMANIKKKMFYRLNGRKIMCKGSEVCDVMKMSSAS